MLLLLFFIRLCSMFYKIAVLPYTMALIKNVAEDTI